MPEVLQPALELTSLGADSPFPGLRPYEEWDADWFFGRSGEINELLKRLRRLHFVAVVGASGSGKSSLVRAGVLPQVRDGYLDADWTMATFRPGDRPIAHLAEPLAAELRAEPAEMEAMLRTGPQGLVRALRASWPTPETRVLIVVDQFEELFSFAQRGGEAAQEEVKEFLKLLLAAAVSHEIPAYVVVTMRIEWLSECATYPGLAEAINEGLYLVPQMGRQQFQRAILEPLELAGGSATNSLVDRMLNDLDNRSDQLPVLQHALMRMWQRRTPGEPLDGALYEAVGTLGNCLSAHAEEVYDELPAADRGLAERLFRSITQVNKGRKIRRPRSLGEIAAEAGVGTAELVGPIKAFSRPGRSFLVLTQGELNADSIVDLSHEALIRQWSRLSGWVEDQAELAARLHRLEDDAAEWNRDRRRFQACLYRGAQLQRAEKLRPMLASVSRESDFLRASARARLWRRLRSQGLILAGVLIAVVLVVNHYHENAERARASLALATAEKQKAQAEASFASLQAKKAQEFQTSIVKQIESAKGSATALAAIAQTIQAQRVYLSFTEGEGAAARQAEARLRSHGYAVPGLQQASGTQAPARSEVHYFRAEDRAGALHIASLLGALAPGGLGTAASPNPGAVIPAGQFEVWLVPAAAAATAAPAETPKPAALSPVAAPPPAPVVAPTLEAALSQDKVTVGAGATLSWKSANASEVSISGIGAVQPSGSLLVTPRQSTSYQLTAKSPGGTVERTVALTVVPAPAAAPAAVANPEPLAIQAALYRYKEAYESESVDALRQVWPTLSKGQEKETRAVFNQFNAIRLDLTCPDADIHISGDTATASCKEVAAYTMRGQRQPEMTTTTRFQLRKQNGNWAVVGVQ